MNERIKELAEQSMVEAPYEFGGTYLTFSKEKFAELIVRECMDICEHKGDAGLDGHYCADEIKQHFGIEE